MQARHCLIMMLVTRENVIAMLWFAPGEVRMRLRVGRLVTRVADGAVPMKMRLMMLLVLLQRQVGLRQRRELMTMEVRVGEALNQIRALLLLLSPILKQRLLKWMLMRLARL